MIQTKTKKANEKLAVLTPKSSEKILKNLQGKGIIVEKDGKHVTVEHPNKKYCIRLSAVDELPKLPNEAILEEINQLDAHEDATFRSKGGRLYKMQIGLIFFMP